MKVICELCPRYCTLEEEQLGFCHGRKNHNNQIICENYGKITSIALDPIEKKPLRQFFPSSKILSVGSYGCNLRCAFCQNYSIAQVSGDSINTAYVSPETLVNKAFELKSQGNIGIAYTYNEPLIGYEYVLDCAKLAHKHGLKNVLVTNGYICHEPFEKLLPYIDGFNVDLKGFNPEFYKIVGGDLDAVKENIMIASKKSHVEVTTLIIPDLNDSPNEIEKEALWLKSVSPNIPLHISRFFPCYQMTDKNPTPVETIYLLASIAAKHLNFVYTGNC